MAVYTAEYTVDGSSRRVSHTFHADSDKAAIAASNRELDRLPERFPLATGFRVKSLVEQDSPRRAVATYPACGGRIMSAVD